MISWIVPFVQKNKDVHEVTRSNTNRLELDVLIENGIEQFQLREKIIAYSIVTGWPNCKFPHKHSLFRVGASVNAAGTILDLSTNRKIVTNAQKSV